MLGKALIFAGYFATVGYAVGKLDIDRKVVSLVKRSYTELVAQTKAIPPADQPKTVALNGD